MSGIIVKDSSHSPLGPSAASRWLNCPGSVALSEGEPNPDSDAALEGTAAHELAAECSNQNRTAESFMGEVISVPRVDGGTYEYEVDEEMAGHVQRFLDFVHEFEADVTMIEDRVGFGDWVPGGYGSLDCGQVFGNTARVVDLKYGKGVRVSAQDNMQLKIYALGMLESLSGLHNIEKFELVIHQPRLDNVDIFRIKTADLLVWAETVLKPGAALALSDAAPLVVGDWCLFCRAKAKCTAKYEDVLGKVMTEFDNLDDVKDLVPAEVTNDQLAGVLPHLKAIKAWCKDVEVRAKDELLRGFPVGDYKLVAGRSSRRWLDDMEAVKQLVESGVDHDDLFETKLLSVPKIEKLVGKKHAVMVDLVIKSPGAATLAPGHDKRASIFDSSDDFEDLS